MTYTLSSDQVHYTWSSAHKPIVSIYSGDELAVSSRDGFDGQFGDLDIADLRYGWGSLDFSRIAPLTGPVQVHGLRAGQVVRIDILEVRSDGEGYTVLWPAWAELDFCRPSGVSPGGNVFRFEPETLDGQSVRVGGGLVRLRPMLGMVGVAPALGEFTTLPPRAFGGNLDCRRLTSGASIFIRAQVDGGLISFGDGHAVQGDGELCTTAIECPMVSRVKISVAEEEHRALVEPWIVSDTAISFTATGATLEAASRNAVNYAHDFLTTEAQFSADEAYALLSLAGDLRVSQVVNAPRLGARVEFPREVLGDAWMKGPTGA